MKNIEKYRNKLFSILGDSISTLDGYSEPDGMAFYAAGKKYEAQVFSPEDTWWGIVIQALGAELLVNNSISGSMVSDHPCCLIPTYACSDERTSTLGKNEKEPDVIMVMVGTNDWGCGVKPIPENDLESADPCVFSVAYSMMLDKLRTNYPRSEIWCFTLPVNSKKQNEELEFSYRSHGRHIEEYCDVIRSVSEKFGCRVVDLYSELLSFDTIDGFHPNVSGMKSIADVILSKM